LAVWLLVCWLCGFLFLASGLGFGFWLLALGLADLWTLSLWLLAFFSLGFVFVWLFAFGLLGLFGFWLLATVFGVWRFSHWPLFFLAFCVWTFGTFWRLASGCWLLAVWLLSFDCLAFGSCFLTFGIWLLSLDLWLLVCGFWPFGLWSLSFWLFCCLALAFFDFGFLFFGLWLLFFWLLLLAVGF